MRIVALVPVKHISERVTSKNFRSFFKDKSLLEVKLEQLKECGAFAEIYVSSDSPRAREIAADLGVQFIERDVSLCNNDVPWSDVIYEVVKSIPEDPECHVAWCHTTSPTFNSMEQCVSAYKSAIQQKKYNGLVATTLCKEFIIDDSGTPVNYSWGPWHKYSQFLKTYHFISGALFIARKNEMLRNRYVIATNPIFYEVEALQSIDIDTDFDFEYAQYVYEKYSSKFIGKER